MGKTGKLRIKQIAKAKGLKAKDIAEHCKVSMSTVKKWYTNLREPRLIHLVKIAELFGVTIDELFYEESEDHNV